MTALLRLWRGELPLSEAFWTWAVIVGLVVNVTTTLGFLFLLTQRQTVAALVVGHGIAVPYNIVATVGVWRSAGRDAGSPARARLVRAVTVAGMLLLSVI